MKRFAVVVPTIRDMSPFLDGWDELFKKHAVELVVVRDGVQPHIQWGTQQYSLEDVLGQDADLIANLNSGVRNLGSAFVAKRLPHVTHILTLDDDTLPEGDTIADHLSALSKRVPLSWLSTSMTQYMRGFPYANREEAPVWISHGVWSGVPDLDAQTQLKGIFPQDFYRGPIPKGVLFPMCGMNVAFVREALPYMYFAPMSGDIQRFDDIWGGIEMKKDLDALGKGVVSGYATVVHKRASDVHKNLILEARGITMNDQYGADPYFASFFEKRARWKKLFQ